jgi:phosphatidylglycerophosphate synthase
MWAAHALTLLRIPLGLALIGVHDDRVAAVAVIALAALSDVADGNVARWMQRRGHRTPDIGGWLDPLVDKLFVALALGAVIVHTGDVLAVALIAVRELAIVPIAVIHLARHRPVRTVHAAPIGKAATIAQLVALGVAFGAPHALVPFAAFAGVLGAAAAVHYLADELRATS